MRKWLTPLVGLGCLAAVLAAPVQTAEAASVPKAPCGPGGYYGGGGGEGYVPGGPNFYGSLLVTRPASVAASTDKNGDNWLCRTAAGYFDNNGAKLPTAGKSEVITLGDMMGPPIGDGLCCNGDLFLDKQHNRFHAAGTSATSGQFNSTRTFTYDGNDVFYIDGQKVSLQTFEDRGVIEGFLFYTTLAPANKTTVWSSYRHEV